MELDATVGGANANSFVTLEEAGDIVASLPPAQRDVWTEAGLVSPPNQEAGLITAALRISRESGWLGDRASTSQFLPFPRTGVTIDGVTLPSDANPFGIKYAQVKLAILMLQDDLIADTGLEGFEMVKVGPIEIRTRHLQAGGSLPSDVAQDLNVFKGVGLYQFKIERG